MRRLFIIILLLVLPLQVTWAAVAGYCKHESGSAAKHVGHHEHKHHAQKSEPARDGSGLSIDKDCMVCHLGAAGMITVALADAAPDHQASVFIAADADFFKLLPPDRPERPKWQRAV